MKTNPLKFFGGLVVVFCLSLLGLSQSLSAAIFADNFDSYAPTNRLTLGANWPSVIPSTTNQYWRAGYWGTNAIVDATSLGRSGNVYASSVASGQNNAFSQTFSTNPYTTENWSLTFDFYIGSLTAGTNVGADLIDIFSTGGTNNFASSNSISKVYLYTNNGTNKVGVRAGDSLGVYNYAFFNTTNVNAGQWYTLSITGNNTAQTLNFTLTDGVTNWNITNKYYTKDVHEFDGFVIGNTSDVLPSTYYLDNISVVPEPKVTFLMGIGVLGLVLAIFRKGKRA